MPPVTYARPTSWEGATQALATPTACAHGGGTDLVPLMREAIVTPSSIVDLREVEGSTVVESRPDGSLHIGAAVTLHTLGTHPLVRRDFPALAEAANGVGSYAIRQVATLGGNLCQRVRCWYFRGDHPCLRRGGTSCSAEVGEHAYHAIFRQGGCVVAHPSDCAVALVALDATIHVRSLHGARDVLAGAFIVPSRERLDGETALGPGEVVVGITLPSHAAGGSQLFIKQYQRAAWDFALVSLAAHRRLDGEVRLVLGGVANTPWRVSHSVEEDVASGRLGDDDIDTLADRALYDAQPLPGTTYKVDVAAALLRRGTRHLVTNR